MDPAEELARSSVRDAVGPNVFQTLETFVRSLDVWGAKTNLVSASDRERLWSRHILDSLQFVGLAEGLGPRWIDLGAGAGFPGLVVAIARPGTAMTLVEANRKKAAFLTQAAGLCSVPVEVAAQRAEHLAARAHDVVSARALAPLPKLLRLALPFFGPQTTGLFAKGREAHAEIEAARQDFAFTARARESRTDPDGAIVTVTSLRRA